MSPTIKNSRILITGGAGFIGSTLAKRLGSENQLVIFDNMSRSLKGGSENLKGEHIELITGDILDRDALSRAAQGCDYIVHCAAIAGIDTVVKRPVTTMEVNMLGSANLLAVASQTSGLKRCVLFSTSEVFGQHAVNSAEHDNTVIGRVGEARWTYAVSKLAEEHLGFAYHTQMGTPVTVVRPFNVYGPGQIGEGALRTFILRAIAGEPIEIHGDGSQIRAWCYVDDMVEGVVRSMVREEAIGESFNIGNKRTVETISGLANTVIRVLGSSSPITYIWKDYADVELRIPSVEKARKLLEFEAKVDLEEGIRRAAAWYRENDITLDKL